MDFTEKACKLIYEAGKNGAKIIVLSETYIPAYPNWVIEAKPPIEWDKNYINSIYNSLVFIGSDVKLIGKHRKLTPVYHEKIFWTIGSPIDLKCVFKTLLGKIGDLICTEHLNLLLKSANGYSK